MADSFAKVMSLAIFIVLGYVLRRFNILKEEAFAAISALVMNVTLPCVILTNLNGMKIHAEMVMLAALGLGANVILLAWLLFLSHNVKDQNGVTLCASIWAAFLSGLLRSPTSSHSFRRLD